MEPPNREPGKTLERRSLAYSCGVGFTSEKAKVEQIFQRAREGDR
jgi:hypothetical protein